MGKVQKHKGGIKVHTLYDIEAQVPTFFHITPAATNDMKAMPGHTKSAYYIFDRGYNDFANLYKIEQMSDLCSTSKKEFEIQTNLLEKRRLQEYFIRLYNLFCRI